MSSLATIVVVVVFLFVVAVAEGATTCPDVQPMENFNATLWSGVWNLVKVSKEDDQLTGDKCAKQFIHANSDGSVSILFVAVNISTGITFGSNLLGTQVGSVPGKYSFTAAEFTTLKYVTIILDTDYKDYEVHLTCDSHDSQGYFIEVNSKQTSLPSAAVDKVNKALSDANLPNNLVAEHRESCQNC